MLEASALSVLHGDLWITTTIDNSDGIPAGLYTIFHEAFEVGILHAILPHVFVEFSLHDTLDLRVLRLRVLRLHVLYGHGHDLAIHCIVHVICHYGPLLNTLDMVKHEPRILMISSGCMCLTRSTPLPSPSTNILKT
jgi:hypothetical protein